MTIEKEKRSGGMRWLGKRATIPAIVGTAAVFGAALMSGGAAVAAETDDSEALGQVLDSSLLTGELLDASEAQAGNPSAPGPDTTPLNLSLLDVADVDLGSGVSLPLVSAPGGGGLLELGNIGALNSYANADEITHALASAGVVGEDGAINLDPSNPGAYENSTIDVTNLLKQAGLDVVTDGIADEVALELGAVASTAEETAGTVTSDYVLTDAKLNLSSPLVGGLTTGVDGIVDDLGTTLDELVGSEGSVLGSLNNFGLDVNLALARVEIGTGTIGVNGLDTALEGVTENIINEPLVDPNGIVSIDLTSGTIAVDLAKATAGGSLNGLDPNTQLLDSTTINNITQAVTDAVGTLTGKVQAALESVLDSVSLHIVLGAEISLLAGVIPAVDGTVTVDVSLGYLNGTSDVAPVVDTDLSIVGVPVGTVLSGITTPLLEGVFEILQPLISTGLDPLFSGLSGTVTGITAPVISGLQPVFELLDDVVAVKINAQPTEEGGVGKLGAESFTVSAVSLTLGQGALAQVDLASSTVRALDEVPAFDPTLDAGDSVEVGGDLPITSTGWPPNTEVTVTVTDPNGDPVGDPFTVTTDADGNFPDGTTFTVPEGTEPGTGFTVTGEDADGNTANDTFEVTEAATDSDTTDATDDTATDDTATDDTATDDTATDDTATDDTATDDTATDDTATDDTATDDTATDDTATDDTATDDTATDDTATDDTATDDTATDDTATDDTATDDTATDDTATDDTATDDTATDDTATDDTATDDTATDDTATDDTATDDTATDDTATDDTATDDTATDDTATDDTATDDTATDDTATDDTATDDTATDDTATDDTATDDTATDDTATDDTATDDTATDDTATDDTATDDTATDDTATDDTATDDTATDDTATDDTATDDTATDDTATDDTATDDTATDDTATDDTATDDTATDDTATDDTATDDTATDDTATDDTATDDTATDDTATDDTATDDTATDDTATDDTATDDTATDDAATDDAATDDTATDDTATDDTATDDTATDDTATDDSVTDDSATDDGDDNGALSIDVEHPVIQVGAQQTAVGHGFEPGEEVAGEMHSETLELGTVTADDNGDATFTWTIPAGTTLTTHEVELTGVDSGSVAGDFRVIAANADSDTDGSGDGNLAVTGADLGWTVPAGFGLLVIGLLAFAISRRKSTV